MTRSPANGQPTRFTTVGFGATVTLLEEQVMLTPRSEAISHSEEDHSLLLASICSEHKEISLTAFIGLGLASENQSFKTLYPS